MNDQLMLFENHEVLILRKEDVKFDFKGDFLILAKNVANALEYGRTEEVTKFCKTGQIFIVKNSDISVSALNRIRKLNNAGESFITNLALNRVLGKSEKPKAEPFQDWLYESVLPSIQKTGAYAVEQTPKLPQNYKEALVALLEQVEQNEKLYTENLMLEQRVAEYEPKASYVDEILQSKSTVTITQIAKDYGLSGQQLNQILHEEGVQYKINDQWLLYAKHHNEGYTKSETIHYFDRSGERQVKMITKWTQKGRLFIHRILEKRNIIPFVDRKYVQSAEEAK